MSYSVQKLRFEGKLQVSLCSKCPLQTRCLKIFVHRWPRSNLVVIEANFSDGFEN